MSRSRRALQRTSALALALCIVAQLAGSVHRATAHHVACAEHGGVVEVHPRTADLPPSTRPVIRDGDETHHAHCDRCATPLARASTAAPPRVARLDLTLPAIERSRSGGEPIPLLHLAPKGSPPRA
jgi:hypothetical protein